MSCICLLGNTMPPQTGINFLSCSLKDSKDTRMVNSTPCHPGFETCQPRTTGSQGVSEAAWIQRRVSRQLDEWKQSVLSRNMSSLKLQSSCRGIMTKTAGRLSSSFYAVSCILEPKPDTDTLPATKVEGWAGGEANANILECWYKSWTKYLEVILNHPLKGLYTINRSNLFLKYKVGTTHKN